MLILHVYLYNFYFICLSIFFVNMEQINLKLETDIGSKGVRPLRETEPIRLCRAKLVKQLTGRPIYSEYYLCHNKRFLNKTNKIKKKKKKIIFIPEAICSTIVYEFLLICLSLIFKV